MARAKQILLDEPGPFSEVHGPTSSRRQLNCLEPDWIAGCAHPWFDRQTSKCLASSIPLFFRSVD